MSKWIDLETDASTGKPYLWKCDECGEEVETKYNFCPECGDPKTSKGKSINTLVKALEAEHKKLLEMQKALPEIIYCNDCKYRGASNYCVYGTILAWITKSNDFCSRGERKNDG